MKIFGIVGSSLEQLGGGIQDGMVEMKERRPTSEHVANKNGKWILPMTLEEKLKSKEITQEEYNEQSNVDIIAQIRAIEDTDTYRRKLLNATIGDVEAIEWLKTKEEEKQILRELLK